MDVVCVLGFEVKLCRYLRVLLHRIGYNNVI